MATGHSAESHKETRKKQDSNVDEYHHPTEKIAQLEEFGDLLTGNILEVFAGKGNLTKYYERFGKVEAMTRETHGDSFHAIYDLRANRRKFNVIDIDSYGYPSKFFPLVFEMMTPENLLVITFPVPGVNCLNGIMEQHFINFWRSARPTVGDVTGILTDMALREWRHLQLLSVRKIKSIWRMVFLSNRVKATEWCNVKNR
jgi:hypothetical protein